MADDNIKIELRTNRVEALSDGIFAIAMTLLVISFEIIFQPRQQMRENQFQQLLLAMWPDFLHYVESFILLGAFWLEHHRQFHFIKKVDGNLLLINILGLMFITLVPFSTAVAGDYAHLRLPALIFELNILIAGTIFYVHWLYATNKHRLVESGLNQEFIDFHKKTNAIIPIISVFAIIFSLFSPRTGTVFYFTVPFIFFLHKSKDIVATAR